MRIARLNELDVRPWKNGGGVTRDIASAQAGDKPLWRLSLADVASDGPFSDFSGLTRVLTVIEGGAMELVTPEAVLIARPWVPLRFDGGLKVQSRLEAGPLRDLNLFFDPVLAKGDVEVLHGPLDRALSSDAARLCALHCLAGRIEVGQDTALERGDTALLGAECLRLRLSEGTSALLATVEPHPTS